MSRGSETALQDSRIRRWSNSADMIEADVNDDDDQKRAFA